jgi:hypothetical protein
LYEQDPQGGLAGRVKFEMTGKPVKQFARGPIARATSEVRTTSQAITTGTSTGAAKGPATGPATGPAPGETHLANDLLPEMEPDATEASNNPESIVDATRAADRRRMIAFHIHHLITALLQTEWSTSDTLNLESLKKMARVVLKFIRTPTVQIGMPIGNKWRDPDNPIRWPTTVPAATSENKRSVMIGYALMVETYSALMELDRFDDLREWWEIILAMNEYDLECPFLEILLVK